MSNGEDAIPDARFWILWNHAPECLKQAIRNEAERREFGKQVVVNLGFLKEEFLESKHVDWTPEVV